MKELICDLDWSKIVFGEQALIERKKFVDLKPDTAFYIVGVLQYSVPRSPT
jgi:hypothetical protein